MTAYFSVVNFVQCDKTIFILALWFHMLAKDFGVGVNVFWRELEDPHGNKDHLPAAKALRMLDNGMKQQRVSSVQWQWVRVLTHYNVMDNIYCQVMGHKDVLRPPSKEQFPLFPLAKQYKADLQPGDILLAVP